ncbi:hypothetical protein J1605_004989 [Eschrichtius robustus]|uniref:Uncharacterized protein n=1 Tax=Eschrichtius robustus TaxID=9764 RepID=A0AB34HDI4_ESCRO|nr:hypothetical protein J1605_004989 [Eschrichtius robustus]
MHRKRKARAAGAVPQPASRARSRPLALCPPQPNPAPAGAERRAGIASPGQSERARPPPSRHLEDMEVKEPVARGRGGERGRDPSGEPGAPGSLLPPREHGECPPLPRLLANSGGSPLVLPRGPL